MTLETTRATHQSIHPATTVGVIALTVADLARSRAFYTEAMGFALLSEDDEHVVLGARSTPLLVLNADRGAAAWPRGGASYTGLYHFALLLPTRADLGLWLRHWLSLGLPLPGQGDHLVSEALYLEDPDGHGIEVYRDRPRDEWSWVDGPVRMVADPVDIRGLLADAERVGRPWAGLPEGARLGHVHLQVGHIPTATTFYHDILGFDIVARMPSALFISAGGYHHHIGMNVWHSQGAGPAPDGTVRLRYFTVDLPDEDARRAVLARLDAHSISYTLSGPVVSVEDPWRNVILLRLNAGHNDDVRVLEQAVGQ